MVRPQALLLLGAASALVVSTAVATSSIAQTRHEHNNADGVKRRRLGATSAGDITLQVRI